MNYYDIAILILPIMLLDFDKRNKLGIKKIILTDVLFLIMLLFYEKFDKAIFIISIFVFILANISILIRWDKISDKS